MRARVGDLAIVRFDPSDNDIKVGKQWDEKVGLVIGTGVSASDGTRYCKFIYWNHGTRCCDIIKCDLPPHRLIRVRPKNYWEGTLASLTVDSVMPVELDSFCQDFVR